MEVDILMATYNGQKYLEEQLESILKQTYKNFTLHISDDQSSDGTIEILKKYQKKDKRIKLYFQEKNLGYIKNFEFLLTKATSPYVMLSDQDDIWLDNKVESSLNKLKKEKLDLVIADLLVVDSNLNTMYESYFKKLSLSNNFMNSNNFNLQSLILKNPATGCTMLFKKELLNHILPFPNLKPPYYIHDWYIFVMGQAYGKVGYIDTPLIKYRQHGKNSIGMYLKKGSKLDFLLTARDININYRIHFCEELLKKIKNNRKEEIKEALEYFNKLKKTKIINFHFIQYFKYTKMLNNKLKLKYLIVFHLPLLILSLKKES